MSFNLSDLSLIGVVAMVFSAAVLITHLLFASKKIDLTSRTSFYLLALSLVLLGGSVTQEVWSEFNPPAGTRIHELDVLAFTFEMLRILLIVFVVNVAIAVAAFTVRKQEAGKWPLG